MRTSHLGGIFLTVFIPSILLSLAIFSFFGFEIGLIFTICFSLAVITTAIAGLENITIQAHQKNKDAPEDIGFE